MQDHIPQAIDDFQPSLIFYNAGSDIMKGDPLGGCQVRECLLKLTKFLDKRRGNNFQGRIHVQMGTRA